MVEKSQCVFCKVILIRTEDLGWKDEDHKTQCIHSPSGKHEVK